MSQWGARMRAERRWMRPWRGTIEMRGGAIFLSRVNAI
jgi:hypothetical protein